MTPNKTTAVLRQFNEWQRGRNTVLRPSSNELGEAIDTAVEMLERLEEAEKDVALKERVIDALGSELNAVANERDTLRAKIEQMERQEPVGKFIQHPSNGLWEQDWYGDNPDARSLYALPGAQPAPSINEGVRKVTLGFRWESEAQHHIPTIEIEFDPVSPDSPNDAKGWQDRDRIASMLSPEAKP